MKRRAWGALALIVLAGCARQASVSGTYLAHFSDGVALLQLTQSQQVQIMGTLAIVVVKPDGRAEHHDASITGGTVDANAHSLTLSMKSNEAFLITQNVTGTVLDHSIDLDLSGAVAHFAPAQPADFDTAINGLVSDGKQKEQLQNQAKAMADEVGHIRSLTSDLKAYNDRIQGSTWTTEVPRAQEEQLVERARHGLDVQRKLRASHRDVDANQVGVQIAQLGVAMDQLKIGADQGIQQGRQHLAIFDQALAKSPCKSTAALDGCASLAEEKIRYATTRAKVEGNLAQAESDIERNLAAMKAVSKEAGN